MLVNKNVFTLVIDQESHVSVLQSGVGQEDRVVRLDYGCGHLTHGSLVTVTMSHYRVEIND